MSDKLRITGLATGLDVDTMVKTMMKAENARLDKIKQDRQLVQWKQDLYRDILGDINTFKTTYFDVLKSDTYMLSSNNYAGFDVSSADSASSTAAPTATAAAGAGAMGGVYSVVVNQLAKPAVIEGSSITNNRATVNVSGGLIDRNEWAGKTISFNINGTDYTLDALPDYTDTTNYPDGITIDILVSDINMRIASKTEINGKVSISKVGSNIIQFNSLSGSTVKVNTSGTTAVFTGLTKDRIINPTVSTKLSDFGISSSTTINITYNGTTKSVSLNPVDTLSDFINNISKATSGNVIGKFSELTGKFSLHTSKTGSSNSISIDTAIPELGIASTVGTPGQDANVTITSPDNNNTSFTVIKATNTFTIDGITYNLQSEDSTKTTKITVTSNVQKSFDKIKAFIDKYNEIVTKIQGKLTEKKQYDYKPLTDDQKKEMKDDEIKAWETKAKQGILKGDSMLQGMLYSMRKAFYDSVEGAGISLSEAGLSTDSDYLNGGKIIIDEPKLKDALKNNGDAVSKLFMRDCDISYDVDHKTDKDRYKQVGIFQRINDILKDYTRTNRDSNGNKGLLIMTAGITGDMSEFDNIITKQLTNDYDKRIKDLQEKLAEKEERYYQQFSQLETAMQKLNAQSSWLMQQLGMGGSN